MNRAERVVLELPGWVEGFVAAWPHALETVEQRMALAVALSAENVARGSGGPFGAIVVRESDFRLLGAGVNTVTRSCISLAHAEMVAVSMAQAAVGGWNLGAVGSVQLVTSCEPCAMCYGAVPWSGVQGLAGGARREDAEAAGFDEGDKPEDWQQALERRGITTRGDVLRAEAAAVLEHYARTDGTIYHPENQ